MRKLFAVLMAVVFVSPLFAHDTAKIRDLERELLDLKKTVIELKQQNMELEDALINLEKKVHGRQIKKRFYVVKVEPTAIPTAVPTPVPTPVPTLAAVSKVQIIDVKARPERMAGRNRMVSYTVSAVNESRHPERNVVIRLIFKDEADRTLHIEELAPAVFERFQEKNITGEIAMRAEKADAIKSVAAEVK